MSRGNEIRFESLERLSEFLHIESGLFYVKVNSEEAIRSDPDEGDERTTIKPTDWVRRV